MEITSAFRHANDDDCVLRSFSSAVSTRFSSPTRRRLNVVVPFPAIDLGRAQVERGECSGGPHFALKDLWASFDEWSAYGAEVPLVLDVEDAEVFQYYVPFLSGMQIFMATELGAASEAEAEAEAEVRLGAEGGARAGDAHGAEAKVRDASRESSETSAGERPLLHPTSPARPSSRAVSPPPDAEEALDPKHMASPPRDGGQGKGLLSSGARATKTGEVVPGRRLVFQFMEQASPYSRAPLSDTIATLAANEPDLLTLTSDELHPASWVCIAWYPIYRIPVGRSLRDLSACFLTYHSLSTAAGGLVSTRGRRAPSEDGSDGTVSTTETRSEEWIAAGGCPAPPPVSTFGEARMASRFNRQRGMDPTAHPMSIGLRAFGMSYYKMRGEMWQAAEVADWIGMMTEGAYKWLRKLKVIHPDFEFFSHHG